MNFLEETIIRDGLVKSEKVLKVDGFLNHRIDIALLEKMGEEFYLRFRDKPINKILTIEASGIAIAAFVAKAFNVPMVFAKKSKTSNISDDVYSTKVMSFTHQLESTVMVSKEFLSSDDHILIIDDFLANGCAMQGLISLIRQAGGTIEGIGIAIEKAFQPGGAIIRSQGYHLESLAIIKSMNPETKEIEFV